MKRVLLSFVFILSFIALNAQSTAWLNPSSTKNNNGVGNVNAVFTSDNNRASWNNDNDYADYGNFNINLPSGAIIEGIEVRVEGYSDSFFGFDREARILLSWNNGSNFTSYKQVDLSTSENIYAIGGNTDDWGHSSWTPVQLNNSNFRVRIDNDGGSQTMYINHLQVKIHYIICNPITSFPYTQNFDSWSTSNPVSNCTADGSVNLNDCWTNESGDDIDWDINAGITGSSGTGPSGDHTSGGGNYLYTEASGGGSCNNSLGYITTPVFDFSSLVNPELTFWYHMNGGDMGTLSVQVSTNGGANWSGNIWSLSGDQPDSWQEASAISLAAYAGNSNVKVRFSGLTGNGFQSDMAIDDIYIEDAPLPAVLSTSTLNGFGDVCINTTAGPNNFIITGTDLTNDDVIVQPLSGYTFSTTSGGTYTSSLNISQPGGNFTQTIYVKFSPTADGSYDGLISVEGGGAIDASKVSTFGNGYSAPTIATSSFPLNNATDVCYDGGGAVTSIAWNDVDGATSYDVYFGSGSLPGSVTQNVAGTSYNTGTLLASTTYYWKIVPKNSCGDATGAMTWNFTTASTSCSDDYCDITFADVRSITRVKFGTIDNYSSPLTGSPSYENYTSLSTDVIAGSDETILVEGFTNGNFEYQYTVFFDWDQDGNFNDGPYDIGTITNSTGVDGAFTDLSISIPTTALSGPTTMRVIGHLSSEAVTPCGVYTEGQVEDYTVNVIPCAVGNPNLFGDNEWNVYAYNGDDIDLSGISYAGYYTESNLTFDSESRWLRTESPSTASGYQGCDVGFDNHTVVYKRTNFDCGIYQIDVTSHDDAARLYIDGAQVFEHIGCCDSHNNVWSGQLDTNSTVEFRVEEQGGGSYGALTFTLIPTTVEFTSDTQVVPTGGIVNFSEGSSGTITAYQWSITPSTGVVYINGTSATSQNPEVQFNSLGSYTVDLTVTDICGDSYTESKGNYILASNDMVFDTDGTFTVPCGITSITVEAWGGGGAGGGSSSGFFQTRSGSGGQGGSYATNTITVSPGDILTIDVANSVSGVNASNGNNGNSSTIIGFEADIFAVGGQGGQANASTSNTSGAGGSGANGGGSGGTSVNATNDGNSGSNPGGGGSGSSTFGTSIFGTTSRTGGNGAGGRIILSWGTDAVPPIAVTQNVTLQLDNNGNASIITADIDNGSFDECSAVTLALDITSFDCSNVGANTVTLTVTDFEGNTSTETATVTVEDNVDAVVLTQDITIQLDANGDASITPGDVDAGSNDACGIASLSVSPNTFDCSNIGANTVTLTATDNNGNVSSETATVTVEDNIAAVVLTQDITIQLDATGNTSIVPADVDAGSNDACGIASLSVSPNTFDCSNIGANTVTLTATDNNGNVSSATATVTVEDNIAAVVLTQDITIQLDATGNASIVPADVDAGSNDACGIASLSVSPNTFDCSNIGANTVTLTATDNNGNVSSATATVTVEDNIAAVVLTQDITIQLDANGDASITPGDVDAGSNDACGIASLSVSPNTFDCSNIGANTVTLTATDNNGNVSSETAVVTVEDNVDAVVLTQDITIQLDATGNASIIPADVDAGSNDACGIASLSVSPNTFDCSNIGANTVTLTATDNNGNVSSETAVVTVEDNVDAVVLTQDITIQLDATGNASIIPADVDAGSNDACGIASLSVSPNTFDCSNIGANTVTLTATDNNGNVSSETAVVTVEDNVDAVVLTQDITIQLDATGNASIIPADVDAGSNDACGIASLSVSPNTFDCSNIGANTVTLTATDNNGNVSSETATVTVEDNIAAVVLTQDITIQLDATGNTSIVPADVDAGSNDACGIASLSVSPNTFDCSNIGANTVTLTATDNNGNVSSATATVTVEDNIAAVVLTQDITIQLDATGNTSIVPADVDAGSNDACGIASLSVSPNTFDCSNIGANTVTLTATDNNGNVSSATATVTVEDNIAAVVLTQDITIQLDATGNTSIVPADVDAGSNDACGIASLSVSPNTFDCSNIGANTVTLTATDNNGNVSSATATVTVEDNIAAVVLTQDITIQLDATGNASIVPADVDAGSNDACGIASLSVSPNTFDCSNVGGSSVASDLFFSEYGEAGSGSNKYLEIYNGTGSPVNMSDYELQRVSNGGSFPEATVTLSGTLQDGEVLIARNNAATAPVNSAGNINISDGNISHNGDDAWALVRKSDDTIIDLVGDEGADPGTGWSVAGINNATVDHVLVRKATISDGNNNWDSSRGNNAANSEWIVLSDFDYSDLGTHSFSPSGGGVTVTLTVTDVNGNVSSATATVTVEDNVDPNAITQDITVQLDSSGNVSITPQDIDNGSNDACGIASLELDITSFDCSDIGDNTVILTVTDNNGNVSTANATVTVEDNVNPNVIVQDITVQLDASGNTSIVPTDVDNGSNDACGIASLSVSPNSFDCSNVGANTVTLTVTDNNGNVSTATATVTVEDNVAPNAIAQDITVQLDASGNATITAAQIDNGSSDACGIASLTLDNYDFSCDDLSVLGGSSSSDLFISEYIEGGSFNKCIEIYNGTGATVDLGSGGYSLELYANGSSTASQTLNLSDSVADGDVYVICHSSATSAFLDEADLTNNSVINFNGDDAIVLLKNGAAIDIIGQTGVDPGTQWSNGGNSTLNQTLVRNSDVTDGNTDNASGFPSLGIEWTGSAQDDASNLGSHSVSGGGNVVTLTVTDVNGNVSTATANVTVEDNIDPTISDVADVTINCEDDTSSASNGTATASDNCSSTGLTITESDVSTQDANPLNAGHYNYTITRTWRATDISGNFTESVQVITVQDVTAPTITDVADVTINCEDDITSSANGTATGSDICSPVTITESDVSTQNADINDPGHYNYTITRTWRATDISGNFTESVQVITVQDVTAPTITDVADVTINCEDDITSSANGTATGSDICSPVTITESDVSTQNADINDPGHYNYTITRTWRATDISGNFTESVQVITVQDVTAPTISDVADVTINCEDDITSSANGTATGSDICSPVTITESDVSTQNANINDPGHYNYTITRTWRATDVSGNFTESVQVITVQDVTAPTITDVADVTINCEDDITSSANGTATGSDICSPVTITESDVSTQNADINDPGHYNYTITRTWRATDISGNFTESVQVITVQDVTAPSITDVADVTINCEDDITSSANGTATGSDICSPVTITESDVSTQNADINAPGHYNYTITRTWRATDISGNFTESVQVITVQDVTAPSITDVADVTINCEDDITSSANGTATGSDICSPVTITESDVSTQNSDINDPGHYNYTITRTWRATDISGNFTESVQVITVQDVTAPVVDCNSFTVELNDDGTVSITSDDIDNGSYDNCSPVTVSISQEDFDCSDIGGDLDELIISEYIDGTGNNKWIEIYNGTGNEVILANGFNSIYSLNIYPDGSSTPTTIGLLGSIPADGVYKIAHTAAIGSNINLGSPNMVFDGNDAIALMNNGNAVDIIGVIGQDPGAAGWSSGGISTNNTTLVRDKNVLVGNTSNFLGGLGTEWIQSSQDTFANLGVHDIEITGFSNNVILTVTDVSGNTATCEAEITIVDVTKPDVECNDITVELDASGNYSLTQSDFNAIGLGSTDACGIASMTASPSSFTCANVGANTVTLTVTDVNGNFDTCVATVTVQDNIVPVVVTQDITVQLNASGNVSITPAQIDNGSNDACGIDTLSVSPNSFTCAEVGANTVTLTVTDVNGNVSTDTAIVTVEDNVAPQAICQAFTIGLDGDGVAVITGADVDGGSNDACGIASLSVFPNTFGCGDIGDNTVTLTVTDNNGNVSTCTTTVTVTGIIPTVSISESPLPEFCQGAVVVLTADSTEAAEYLWSTGETTESIEVPGNGTYSVTVTSLTNCTAYAEYEVTGFDAGALISAYTIIASEKVDLKNSVVVQSGGVGVTDSDGEIKLDKASHIIEFAQADEIEIKAGSSVGTAIYQPANPIIPTFIYNTYSNNSSPDAKANDNQTLTLNGGVYDKVEIEEDATIIFTAPNVYINELKTKKRATIEFTGCTNMFINKDFELDEDGTFNSSGKMVTLYIDDKLEVKKGSNFTGRVYANDEDIKVKGGNNSDVTTMTGIFIGKKVEADKNVIWNADYNCDTCPVEAPENNGGEEPTEDYVIIGFNEVHLHGDIAVQTGGVGVTKHNKKIKVHDDSDITEFAKASKIQVNGGSTVGTKIYQQADPIIPLFVINTYSNNGSPDVTVNNGQTVTLNGDNYDKIDLKDGATVIFTETNVYVKELKTDKDVSIEFTGCTNLIIKKKFKLDDRGTINSDGHKVTIYVDDKVEIDKGSWVDANIYAYNDEIDIDGSNNDATFMTGLFIGKKVHAHENVIFNQGQTGAPCAVAPPSDIYTEANDEGVDLEGITMEVTSWPNPSDNEFNVKVTSENTTDVITINVFDMSNKLVHSDEFRPDEVHKFGNRLEGGVYIVKVSQGDKVRTVRLVKY